MNVKESYKTKVGWEISATIKKGGVWREREMLYTKKTLADHGVAYRLNPWDWDMNDDLTNAEWLLRHVEPDAVTSKGIIRR